MRSPDALVSGKTIGRSAVWNVFGQVAPAIVGVFATPYIVRGFGAERFGLLTLAWVITGYFSLFDLGLGRAVTKLVAQKLAATERVGLREHVWTAWLLMLLLGVVGGVLLDLSRGWIVEHAVKGSPAIREEARQTFRLLALSVPAIVLMTGFRGVLEAGQYFGRVNAVRIPFGIATFLIPLATLHASSSLLAAVAGLVLARVIGMTALAVMCFRLLGREALPTVPDLATARELLSFGAWITVSNVIGPLMVSFDRFVVSATISIAMVTYYATPFQVAMQLLIVPTAVTTVLFPAFSAAFAHTPTKLARLFWSGIKISTGVIYPAALVLIGLAPEILQVWLGGQFPALSTNTLRWLTVGVLLNGVAQFPFALIQAAGRSDYTAKIHLLELPVYLAALTLVALRFGITGVASVWAARSCADLCLMMLVAFRFVSPSRRAVFGLMMSAAVLGLPILALFLASSFTFRIILTITSIALFLWQSWTRGLDPDQRSALRSFPSTFRLRAATIQ